MKIIITGVVILKRVMDPKPENLDINCSAEFIDCLNSWIDTRGMGNEKAIKGAFLTAVGKEHLTCLEIWSTTKP